MMFIDSKWLLINNPGEGYLLTTTGEDPSSLFLLNSCSNDELIHQLKATDSSRIMVISDLAISHVIDFSILSHNINHTSFIIHHSLAL